MARDSNCPQNIWQARFHAHGLNPFVSDKNTLTYQRLDQPQHWWYNPLNPYSLRLTAVAHNILRKNNAIPSYKFNLYQRILPKTLLQLERHFTGPYFIISPNAIVLYGETEVMMLALHGNNLQQYLDNLTE
jgi:hypothetical protein